MQRLRRVRQLGTTHLVYPSATHTRFSHALGTLRAAQNLMDVVLTQGSGRDPVTDVFSEWRDVDDDNKTYNHNAAEATVLARLGALLHDLGHISFGHTLEDDLKFFQSHDANEVRYNKLWGALVAELGEPSKIAPNGIELNEELMQELKPLILSSSEVAEQGSRKFEFVSDVVGNTICADLIDYLQRDHFHAGLPAALGNRFLDGFYVTPSQRHYMAQRMVIRLKRGEQVRADVVSELFKYLRYRYELGERALEHHAKLAADVMVGKAMEAWETALSSEIEGSQYKAREAMEDEFLRRGDDGILEFMLYEAGGESITEEWTRMRAIVDRLLDRKLFKRIGAFSQNWMADDLYAKFGSRKVRAKLESKAAAAGGVEDVWKVAVWLPNPQMRLKPADVLVDDGSDIGVVPLRAWDEANGRRGAEIMESHKKLWAMRVYVDRTLTLEQCEKVLDELRDLLGISEWDVRSGRGAVGEPRANVGAVVREAWESSDEERRGAVSSGDLVLKRWIGAGRLDIVHPEFEMLVGQADGEVVILDNRTYHLSSENDAAKLNLRLFLRELDQGVFGSNDYRELVRTIVEEDPIGFEDRVWQEFGIGPSVHRTTKEGKVTEPAIVAVERAVEGVLAAERNRRLF